MGDHPMTPEEAQMLDDVAHDDRPGPKRIYADWLEDHGRPELAHACRWAAARRLSPRVSAVRGYATWCRRGFGPRRHCLPDPLIDLLAFGQKRAGYHAVEGALEALAAALAELRTLWEIEP